MVTLNRNKRPFWYALYTGYDMLKDAQGRITGERGPVYSEPVKCFGNIAPAQGDASVAPFGVALDYDRLIQLPGTTPIDEQSVLWIDTDDTTKPYDYKVIRKAVSLNHTTIAVQKVR